MANHILWVALGVLTGAPREGKGEVVQLGGTEVSGGEAGAPRSEGLYKL